MSCSRFTNLSCWPLTTHPFCFKTRSLATMNDLVHGEMLDTNALTLLLHVQAHSNNPASGPRSKFRRLRTNLHPEALRAIRFLSKNNHVLSIPAGESFWYVRMITLSPSHYLTTLLYAQVARPCMTPVYISSTLVATSTAPSFKACQVCLKRRKACKWTARAIRCQWCISLEMACTGSPGARCVKPDLCI